MALVTQAQIVPDVSVIIASYNSSATIERCLEALTTLETAVPFEVVVVDSSQDGTTELIAARFPEVILLESDARLYPGNARNLGVERARAEILAFTDADCIVDDHWIEEIATAHRTDVLAVGGSIDNGNPESLISWANYFCEFTAWMPAGAPRPVLEIPTACLSIKRRAFEEFGPFLVDTLCSDSAFCWRLARSGRPPVFIPSMRVAHLSVTEPSLYFARKWRHGRAFARVRAAEEGLGRFRCLLKLLGSPFVPALLFFRTARSVARARLFRRQFVISAPLVFLGVLLWALGEAGSYSRLVVVQERTEFGMRLRPTLRAWLRALFGLPASPRLLARSLREEGLGFVRFWPRLRATVPGWTGLLEGRTLYALAHHGPGHGAIVEIGSAWGRSTICLARGSKSAGRERVYAIDPHPAIPRTGSWREAGWQKGLGQPTQDHGSSLPWLLDNLQRFGVDDWVEPIVSTSASASSLPIDRIRLLFIDSSHTYEAVKGDIDAWLPRVVSGGVVVFDDYFNMNPKWGVRRAVDELLASGEVRPSLERAGLHVWTYKT